MKCATTILKAICILAMYGLLLTGCKKKNLGGDPVIPGGNNSPDTIATHLQFFNATKRQGISPGGSGGSSLKISFEDTLFLVDQVKMPVKFLHTEAENVTGLYLQVHFSAGKGTSSFYYDVPELPGSADSDTVSVILIGIDPNGLTLPLDFDLTITPYDKNKQPITQSKRPVKVQEPKNDPVSNGGSCGLILPDGERWEWGYSIAHGNNSVDFENYPGKVFGAEGQDIEGSCCKGETTWPDFCVGEKKHNKKLHFGTYYRINFETFRFFDNGKFFRQTMEDSPVPWPEESNFCGSGAGMVKESLKHSTYEGNWLLRKANLPPDLQHLAKRDTLELVLQATGGTGTGYGNPGGVIHYLDCKTGAMTLIQLDREGGRRHLIKFYVRSRNDDPFWYKFV